MTTSCVSALIVWFYGGPWIPAYPCRLQTVLGPFLVSSAEGRAQRGRPSISGTVLLAGACRCGHWILLMSVVAVVAGTVPFGTFRIRGGVSFAGGVFVVRRLTAAR